MHVIENFGKSLFCKKNLDGDTVISKHTWSSSRISSGAVIQAVDSIMKGEVRNAFCAIRPPGHHAGVFGKTK